MQEFWMVAGGVSRQCLLTPDVDGVLEVHRLDSNEAQFSCHPEKNVGSRFSACSEKHFPR
jgi:hypothetical protein